MKTVKSKSEVFGTVYMDSGRIDRARNELAEGYANRDTALIAKASMAIQNYVDEGLDDNEIYSNTIDDYTGDDPETLARQYILKVYHDRYLDDDSDKEYIRTGLKPYMRSWKIAQPVQLSINF